MSRRTRSDLVTETTETAEGVENIGSHSEASRIVSSVGKDERPRALQSKEARAKAAKSLKRRSAVFNTSGPVIDRREVGEVRKLRDAVSAHCRECCGFDPAGSGSMKGAVEDCSGPECHLFLWRDGSFHLDEAEAEVQSLED